MKSILYYLIQIQQFEYAKGASSCYKLVTILRGSLKYLSTMKVEYNSEFGQKKKGFVLLDMNHLIKHELSDLFALPQYIRY